MSTVDLIIYPDSFLPQKQNLGLDLNQICFHVTKPCARVHQPATQTRAQTRWRQLEEALCGSLYLTKAPEWQEEVKIERCERTEGVGRARNCCLFAAAACLCLQTEAHYNAEACCSCVCIYKCVQSYITIRCSAKDVGQSNSRVSFFELREEHRRYETSIHWRVAYRPPPCMLRF